MYTKFLFTLSFMFFLQLRQAHSQWLVQNTTTSSQTWVSTNHTIDTSTVWMGCNDYYFDAQENYVSKSAVAVYNTSDGGASWNYNKLNIDTANYPELETVNGVDASIARVGVYQYSDSKNLILYTNNGGNTWSRIDSNLFTDVYSFINGISFKDKANGVMVGDPANDTNSTIPYFEIYRTADSGATWTRIAANKIPAALPNEYGSPSEICRVGDKIWFLTNAGRLIYSTNGGLDWNAQQVATGFSSFLHFTDSMHGIFAAQDTGILSNGNYVIKYTEDGGANWQYVQSPFVDSTYFWSISLVPGSNYIVCNNASSLANGQFVTLLSKDKGNTWMVIDTGKELSCIKFASSNIAYSGGSSRFIQGLPTRIFKYHDNSLGGLLSGKELVATLELYPNPVQNNLQFRCRFNQAEPGYLLLNTLQGQLLWRHEIQTLAGVWHNNIDVSSLPAATYCLTITTAKGSISKTFIKN